MDSLAYNRRAWDREVEEGNPWTVPVGPEAIAAARRGEWHVVLTPTKPVSRDWFPELAGLDLLCLGSGDGRGASDCPRQLTPPAGPGPARGRM